MLQVVFWASLVGAFYSYFVYPVVLLLLPGRGPAGSGVPAASSWPRLSLIITVHNESSRIAEKLRNSLAVNYPPGLLEVIVASDCSSDATDEIVRSFSGSGVKLVRSDEHRGKEYAQWLAIQAAQGEILVFSDAATQIPPDSLLRIAERFADPTLGALSSEDRFISDDGSIVGEGAYVKYEMWLRSLESRHAGLVGLSGSFFAARKSICVPWDTASPSDFNTALNCSRHGFRSISCGDVLGYYKDIKDPRREYQRKVRTVVRGVTAIARQSEVLNPFRYGFFAFQVWSHKIMRWVVPWCLLVAFLANVGLADDHWFYAATLCAQVVVYGLTALAAWPFPGLRRVMPLRLVYFFLQANIAVMHASLAYMAGRRVVVWSPSQR